MARLDLELVRRACEQKVAIVDWLAERYDPELLFVVFMAADHVHHLAWPDWEERGRESSVAEAYRILDASLGELLKRAGEETNVLVVSDHGGGALQGVVNLNAWLAEQGYLAYTESGSANGGSARRLFELRRKLPKEWRYSVKQRLPWLRERAYRLQAPSVVDWSRTRAFAYGIFGNIVLNVARPRASRHRRARRGVRARCARSCASGCSTCARATASRSSPRCTGARISSRGPSWTRSRTWWSSSATTRGSARAT